MEAGGCGDEASVAAWLRRENSELLKQVRQLKQALQAAEVAANGGVDVEALRQKIGSQGREIERLSAQAQAASAQAEELSAARTRVVALQDRVEEAEAEATEAREAVAEAERLRRRQGFLLEQVWSTSANFRAVCFHHQGAVSPPFTAWF
eukprot:SAG31_NODE_1304_length_8894_cov_22.532689_5_plen_150_part_00